MPVFLLTLLFLIVIRICSGFYPGQEYFSVLIKIISDIRPDFYTGIIFICYDD